MFTLTVQNTTCAVVGTFVSSTDGSASVEGVWFAGTDPDVGVREPRRPILPTLTPGIALELPT